MQIDWPDVLAVAATLATLVASIYGARSSWARPRSAARLSETAASTVPTIRG